MITVRCELHRADKQKARRALNAAGRRPERTDRMNRREYTTDRHGVAVMERPPVETFLGNDDDGTCPICNGRGWTWEMDMDDPDGGGYPETCPVAYQTPELHGQPPVTAAVWCDYTEDREERWRVTITCGDKWQVTGAVTTLRCRPGEVARDLSASYEPVDYERRSSR